MRMKNKDLTIVVLEEVDNQSYIDVTDYYRQCLYGLPMTASSFVTSFKEHYGLQHYQTGHMLLYNQRHYLRILN